jgi:ELWxxDGT repeat protein
MMRRLLFFALAVLGAVPFSHAQPQPFLLKDINPAAAPFGSYNMDPSTFVQMDGVTYYTAYTANLRRQLWRTDGTTAGTRVLTNSPELSWDANSVTMPEISPCLTPMNGSLYFFTTGAGPNSSKTFNLVRSDISGNFQTLGSCVPADQYTFANLLTLQSRPNELDPARKPLTALGNNLFFTFHDPAHGTELWKSDGTPGGTAMLKDLIGGTGSSSPANFKVVGNALYFTANSNNQYQALWKTDGTAAGTVMVKDSVATISGTRMFHAIGNNLYFLSQDVNRGYAVDVWKSDGTAAGTVRVAQPGGYFPMSVLMKQGSNAIYWLDDKLIKYDGSGNTTLTSSVRPLNLNMRSNQWAEVNGVLYFAGENQATRTMGLWKTDGTPGGTVLVKDRISARNLFNANGTLYFAGNDSLGAGIELWKSDGTAAGTVRLSDFNAGSSAWSGDGIFDLSTDYPMVYQNGKVLLTAINDEVTSTIPNSLLAASDGTPGGTALLAHSGSETYGSFPAARFVWNDQMYFAAYEPNTGYELWKTDGTTAGTSMLRDLNPGTRSSFVQAFTPYRGLLYFLASDSTGGQWRHALWRTDGTNAGSIKIKDFLGRGYNDVCRMEVSDTTLVLIAGGSFYKSDGTPAGTEPIFMLFPGAAQESIAANFVMLDNNTAIVAAATYISPYGTIVDELWSLNLAQKTSTKYSNGSMIYNEMVRFNGRIYFTRVNGASNYVLWRTDGTAAGTTIADLTISPHHLTVLNNGDDLYYIGTDVFVGTSLAMRLHAGAGGPVTVGQWDDSKLFYHEYDNAYRYYTFQGPQTMTQLFQSNYHHYNQFFTQAKPGGPVYLPGGDATTGIELYSTDGSANSAGIVRDIRTDSGSGAPQYITPFVTKNGDTLTVFVANDGRNGPEIWYSDGTTGGTRNYAQSLPGSNSLNPRYITLLNGRLIFWGTSHTYGTEPYVYEFQQILKAGGTGSKTADLGLYPNPADQKLMVRSERGARIEVYTMTGVKVLETTAAAATTTLEVGKLVPGMYNVRVTTGASQQSGRFVKL